MDQLSFKLFFRESHHLCPSRAGRSRPSPRPVCTAGLGVILAAEFCPFIKLTSLRLPFCKDNQDGTSSKMVWLGARSQQESRSPPSFHPVSGHCAYESPHVSSLEPWQERPPQYLYSQVGTRPTTPQPRIKLNTWISMAAPKPILGCLDGLSNQAIKWSGSVVSKPSQCRKKF